MGMGKYKKRLLAYSQQLYTLQNTDKRKTEKLWVYQCTRLLQFYKLMKRRVGDPMHGVVKGAKDINSQPLFDFEYSFEWFE